MPVNWVALTVFVLCFGAVTLLGFAAASWRRATSTSCTIGASAGAASAH